MTQVSAAGARFALFCARFIRQTKGRWAGEPLLLEGWQLLAISEALRTAPTAWVDVSDIDDPWEDLAAGLETSRHVTGHRVYTEAYWQLAKKMGKSTLASALGIYFTVGDGEPGAEVYAAATSKDQARIVFEAAKRYVQASPMLSRSITVYRDVLYVPDTDSVFRVLAADAGTTEGLNPSANIIDELHRHKSPDLYQTMTSQTGAREQPFTFVITNAPADTEGICFELFSKARRRPRGLEGPAKTSISSPRACPRHKWAISGLGVRPTRPRGSRMPTSRPRPRSSRPRCSSAGI